MGSEEMPSIDELLKQESIDLEEGDDFLNYVFSLVSPEKKFLLKGKE